MLLENKPERAGLRPPRHPLQVPVRLGGLSAAEGPHA